MCLFKEFPFLLASDASGKVGLWAIPPAVSKRVLIYSWHNVDEKEQNSVVHAIALAENMRYIYTADDKGMIKAYYYTPLLETLGIDSKSNIKEAFKLVNENVLKKIKMDINWKMQTYPEGANSLTFINQEPFFLIATCYNRMAYILRASDGEKIDCIQQGASSLPEPIGYRLKEKHRNFQLPEKTKGVTEEKIKFVAEERRRALEEADKAAASLFKSPLQKFEPGVDESKLIGKSSDWQLCLDVKSIRKQIELKEETVLTDVGSTSRVKTPRSPTIRIQF